jgi:hypothetical protein
MQEKFIQQNYTFILESGEDVALLAPIEAVAYSCSMDWTQEQLYCVYSADYYRLARKLYDLSMIAPRTWVYRGYRLNCIHLSHDCSNVTLIKKYLTPKRSHNIITRKQSTI